MADEETTPEEVTEVVEDAPGPAADSSETGGEAAASGAAERAPAARAAPTAPPAAPAEQLTPKERRQRKRLAKAAPARGQTSPEERQAERDAERLVKARLRRTRRVTERERARQRRAGAGTPEPLPSLRPEKTGQAKTRQGIVVSDRAAKTITVRIDVTRRHPRYEKVVRRSTTLHAHDEKSDAHIGDTVVIRETRPLSRTKRWRLVQVVERAK